MQRTSITVIGLCGLVVLLLLAYFRDDVVRRMPEDSEHWVENSGNEDFLAGKININPWRPSLVRIPDAECSEAVLQDCLARAGAWSEIKWGPSVDEHAIRLMPWAHSSIANVRLASAFKRLSDSSAYGPGGIVLVDSPFGATYRTHAKVKTGIYSVDGLGHIDAALAAFAESGSSLDTIVHTSTKQYSLIDVLTDSLKRSGESREVEWSLVAYCAYLRKLHEWKNCRGQRVTFDDLVRRALDQDRGTGPCQGTHQPWAIAYVLRKAQSDSEMFSIDAVEDCTTWMRRTKELCSQSQLPDGCWDQTWHLDCSSARPVYGTELAQRLERLRVTAHLLEAFAILPLDLRPDAAVLVKGVAYVDSELRSDADLFFRKDFPGSTHAVRMMLLVSSPGQTILPENSR